MTTDPYDIIHAAMLRFVTILCESAWDTEEDPHEDVIALAYAMPPSITETNGIDMHSVKVFAEPGHTASEVADRMTVADRTEGHRPPYSYSYEGSDVEGRWSKRRPAPWAWRHMVLGWLEDGRAPDVVPFRGFGEDRIMARDLVAGDVLVGGTSVEAKVVRVSRWVSGGPGTNIPHRSVDVLTEDGRASVRDDAPGRVRPLRFSGPFLDTFHSNPEWAASLVAKVISDGLDDGLLVGWYDVRGWDEPEDQELHNLASLKTLVDLAGLADNDERRRLLDHVERILDTVEANEAGGRGAVL